MANDGGSSPFESRAPWLSISKLKSRFAYRVSHSLFLSDLANKPPCCYSLFLPFSLFLSASLSVSLPLYVYSNGHQDTDAYASAAEILFRAVEIPVRVVSSRLNDPPNER